MNQLATLPIQSTINYDNLATSYDYIDTFFSVGFTKKWRNVAADLLTDHGPQRLLDLACGSGEQIVSFFSRKIDIISVSGIDISKRMVEKAIKKFSRLQLKHHVFIESGDACSSRFRDNFFDAVTISFSLRDIGNIDELFREAHRVLKNDCPLIILDLNNPNDCKLKYLYSLYMHYIFSTAGGLLSGFPEAYKIFSRRLSALPSTDFLSRQMKNCGFHKVGTYKMFADIAFLITGKKRID